MSKTDDGSKVFVTWMDTDPLLWGGGVTSSPQPDIFTWSFHLTDRMMTEPVNETALGDFWGDNFWMHVGDKVFQSGESEYFITDVTNQETFSNAILEQNFPNLFSGKTYLHLTLAERADVGVEVII